MQLRGKGAQVVMGREGSKQQTNLFTCARDFIQYALGFETENIFWTTVIGSNRNSAC